jgi:RNA-directed DNA polymerase
VRAVITARPMASAGEIIAQLNPIIRGWANYHRHVCSSRAFWQLDNYVFQLLLSWTRRKHRNKNMAWIKQTYFPKVGKQDWLFSGQLANREGLLHPVHLFRATSLPIKRHVKVKNAANPYDPAWEPYFEERMYRRTMQTLAGRIDLEMLLQRQRGVCLMCGEPITQETG